MPTRNTGLLAKIVESLGDLVQNPTDALVRLEEHFKEKLLIVASDTQTIDQQAQQLRLAITTEEGGRVLDYIGEHNLAGVPIETTDEVINALFPDRFQEP
jgi:F420-0:gamma-glutamyl ligase